LVEHAFRLLPLAVDPASWGLRHDRNVTNGRYLPSAFPNGIQSPPLARSSSAPLEAPIPHSTDRVTAAGVASDAPEKLPEWFSDDTPANLIGGALRVRDVADMIVTETRAKITKASIRTRRSPDRPAN